MKYLVSTSIQIASLALLSSMAAVTLAAEDDLLQEFSVVPGGTLFVDSQAGAYRSNAMGRGHGQG